MNETKREIGVRSGVCRNVRYGRSISQNIDWTFDSRNTEILVIVGDGGAQKKVDDTGYGQS
ncbi:hypothetical protein GCM10007921_22240 [Tritonibacter mobilis]|nr:hypothetical protein GCM10007921_22240 [Tritonibacter mobilis]